MFEVTRDASFIDALVPEGDDKPMSEDLGLMSYEVETTDTTTP